MAEQNNPPPWERMLGASTAPNTPMSAPTAPPKKMPWERMLGNALPEISQDDLQSFSDNVNYESDARFDDVFASLIQAESRGRHRDRSGRLTSSPVGAQGITQVMPKTAKNPGYGVKPIRNDSEEEYIRFGRDYLQAMLREFGGDYTKALAAYNAGAGNVKKAITKAEANGVQDWTQYLPKKSETIPYINKILGDGSA